MELDSKNMLGSIDMLGQQIRDAWVEAGKVKLPTPAQPYSNIVVFGMGGSALAADIIRAVFADQLTVPILIVQDYTIPAYVSANSFVVLSSYSGTTEETLAAAKHILDITAQVAVVTTGGELKQFMEQHHVPGYCLEPTYNPCGQPRIAVGYAVAGLLRLLVTVGLVRCSDQEIDDCIHYLEGNRELLRDAGKELVARLANAVPVFVGSEFLLGNLHAVTNQTNENGKNFACWFPIPELNHHLMEGLGYPAVAKQLHFVFVESHLYHERVQKRYGVTKQVLDKQQVAYDSFVTAASTKLMQSFEVLQWGSYLSFYLAMANQIDPSPIPWVDFFKHALKK
jgi:glucose/mannose-6-phosphate isomerase